MSEPENTEQEQEETQEMEVETYEGEVYDAPNQQVVGQPPPWEEGTGGEAGELPSAESTDEEQEGEQPEGETDYDSMTKAELIELAKQRGISPANNDMTKDELKAAIEAG